MGIIIFSILAMSDRLDLAFNPTARKHRGQIDAIFKRIDERLSILWRLIESPNNLDIATEYMDSQEKNDGKKEKTKKRSVSYDSDEEEEPPLKKHK